MSILQWLTSSAGICNLQHLLVHQYGITFTIINPSPWFDFAIAMKWFCNSNEMLAVNAISLGNTTCALLSKASIHCVFHHMSVWVYEHDCLVLYTCGMCHVLPCWLCSHGGLAPLHCICLPTVFCMEYVLLHEPMLHPSSCQIGEHPSSVTALWHCLEPETGIRCKRKGGVQDISVGKLWASFRVKNEAMSRIICSSRSLDLVALHGSTSRCAGTLDLWIQGSTSRLENSVVPWHLLAVLVQGGMAFSLVSC